MPDEKFKLFQEYSANAEKGLRSAIFEWAMGDCPGAMTIGHVRSLSTLVIPLINQAARDAYDIGQGPSPEKD